MSATQIDRNDTPIDRLVLAVTAQRGAVTLPGLTAELGAHYARALSGDVSFAGKILLATGFPSAARIQESLDAFVERFGFLRVVGDHYEPTSAGRYLASINGPYRIPYREAVPLPDQLPRQV